MAYVYAALWIVIGFILILKYRKESPIFYAAGGFFFFLGLWWGADAVLAAADRHMYAIKSAHERTRG